MWAKYRIHPDALGNKLSMPVLALGGTADNTLDAIGLDGWAEVTLGKFQREVFDGGHFYLDGARDAVLVLLNQFIHQIIADLPLAVILGDRPARPEFELCVHEIFERQVDKTPDQLALVGIDQSYTYRELDAAATLLARRLQQLGVCAAVPVGVFLPHSEQCVFVPSPFVPLRLVNVSLIYFCLFTVGM
jgi:non-ribosomal peptide synthetase component F